ncbi:MAG: RDD family protein [Proteobacteria bacterium]|nr:RDD family protein [Pseudomonadota bacterium]
MHGESSTSSPRSTDNRYAVSPATASQSEYRSGGSMPYAGFWKRSGAFVIDYIIVMIVMQVPRLALGPKGGLMALVLPVVGCLYYALMESSSLQATLGKKALDLKVTDLNGERIGLGRALGRLFGHILSYLILGIGFAMAVFTERRQTLHDKIAGTLVVRRAESPEDIAQAGPAPPVSIGLAIVAVIGVMLFGPTGIGLVAAIAIPAYQDYTIRAQITEGLVMAEPFKTAVAAAVAGGTPLNSIDSSKLDVTLPDTAKYVGAIRVAQGAVDIQYGRAANKKITGGHLVLVPGSRGTELHWVCGHAAAPPDVTVSVNDYQRYTNIPDKMLPSACHPPR